MILNKAIKNQFSMSSREISRLIAIMTVYMLKYEHQNRDDVINYLIEENIWYADISDEGLFPEVDRKFLTKLVEGVDIVANKIHVLLASNIVNKRISLDTLDRLLLSILECAVFELIENKLDKNIIISQYTFLTSCFFDSKEISMINGILGSVATVANTK